MLVKVIACMTQSCSLKNLPGRTPCKRGFELEALFLKHLFYLFLHCPFYCELMFNNLKQVITQYRLFTGNVEILADSIINLGKGHV